MGSSANVNPSTTVLVAVITAGLVGFAAADLAQDRAECTQPLLDMAMCLPYVEGKGKAPTPDCCVGLGVVLKKSLKCVCILVKDRDEPELGLKINTTLALGLPSSCHQPVNISQCIELLQLDPNSSDAKMFSEFEKSLEKGNNTHVPAPASNRVPSQPQGTGANLTSGSREKKPFPAALLNVVLVAAILAVLGSGILPFN